MNRPNAMRASSRGTGATDRLSETGSRATRPAPITSTPSRSARSSHHCLLRSILIASLLVEKRPGILRSHLEISQILICAVGTEVGHATLFTIEDLRLRQRMKSYSAAIPLLLAQLD